MGHVGIYDRGGTVRGAVFLLHCCTVTGLSDVSFGYHGLAFPRNPPLAVRRLRVEVTVRGHRNELALEITSLLRLVGEDVLTGSWLSLYREHNTGRFLSDGK